MVTEAQLAGEIADWLRRYISARVLSAERIRRGLMNEKWIIETDKGHLFVKSYHPGRYTGRWDDPEFRGKIEHSLQLQLLFYRSGGPCPQPLEVEGRCMHILPCGRYIAVMTCCPGTVASAGMMGERKMHSLGRAAAKMHTAWESAAASGAAAAAPMEEPAWQVTREELERGWQACWDTAGGSSLRVRNALHVQKSVIDSLGEDAFTPPAAGWAHLDLWADNLLFEGDCLTAIVDFDRARYSFPALDLGRAVLSGVLDEYGFRRDAAAAFAEGYRNVRALPAGSLVRAVKYVWCVESSWWIRPSLEAFSAAPARFAEEMLRTAERWEQLDALLGDI